MEGTSFMDNNRARNRRIERNEDRESITSLTGIIGYSSVPDSNGDTGVYVIPQMGKARLLMNQALQILADIENN
jgi:hypothetical protein